ncbi:AbrB/MazE/SpoVT family DNA-binding domain-containing protein [Candidatus Woesearchaeota archaeon]|nr:AbrB/MazE/SpoVT family DNA-binding domain-containing protein [Candidatus Woesearchaeota archaeon]
MQCPICEKGILKKGKIKETMFGVYLGEFSADICSNCKESFTDEKTTRAIEETAKKKRIWGLGKKTKITKTGNSLAVRIPKEIADFLKLKNGSEAYIHPEKNKIVIEAGV